MSRLARYVGDTSTWTATMTSPSRKKCSTKSCFHNLQGQEKILVTQGSRSWFRQALGRLLRGIIQDLQDQGGNHLRPHASSRPLLVALASKKIESHFSKKSIKTQRQSLEAVIQIYNQLWKNQGWHLKKWQAKITKARHTLCQTSPKFPPICEGLNEVLKELCHRNVIFSLLL